MKLTKVKIILASFMLSVVYFSTSVVPTYAVSIGATTPSGYATGGCNFGEINSTAVLGSEFLSELSALGKNTNKFHYSGTSAWELDLLPKGFYGTSYNNVDDVDYMLFSGHGLLALQSKYHNPPYNSLHFRVMNSYNTADHSNEAHNDLNADSNEIWFGYNSSGITSQTKWVSTYSCNFLNTSGPQWSSIMQGAHMVTGFGSLMYVHANEGKTLGYNLWDENNKILDSFFSGARQFQPYGNDAQVIARVLYAERSEYDSLGSYSTKPEPIGTAGENYYYQSITINPI